jgi:hypothetical protein
MPPRMLSDDTVGVNPILAFVVRKFADSFTDIIL